MTPTATPFEYRGTYTLESGNRVTIIITAKHDRIEDKYGDFKTEYLYTEKATKADVTEAKGWLKHALAECGLQPEDLENKAA